MMVRLDESLYQRCHDDVMMNCCKLYPVDRSRVNEFGELFEENERSKNTKTESDLVNCTLFKFIFYSVYAECLPRIQFHYLKLTLPILYHVSVSVNCAVNPIAQFNVAPSLAS